MLRHEIKDSMAILASAAIILAAVSLLTGCGSSSPDCLVTGSVVDADTGAPIRGAVVSDGTYGPQPTANGTTGADGSYSYMSWYEEHTIAVTADGYAGQTTTIITRPFSKENSVTVDFTLSAE